MRPWRSLLFVPGARPDRFAKAFASGADLACIDLEDATAPDDRGRARQAALAFLASPPTGGALPVLRINATTTDAGREDLAAIAAAGTAPALLLVPKTEDPEELAGIRKLCPGWKLIVLVETPAGVERAPEFAVAPEVVALMLGGADLCTALGAAATFEALLYARGRLLNAAALGGVAIIDTPWLALGDSQGLTEETRRSKAMGFTGKAAIHPKQIPVIHAAFAPTAEEKARARRILEAARDIGEGVIAVDGHMVDRPVVEAARRLLASDDDSAGD